MVQLMDWDDGNHVEFEGLRSIGRGVFMIFLVIGSMPHEPKKSLLD